MHARFLCASFSTPQYIAQLILLTVFLFLASPVYAAETTYTYDSLHRLTKVKNSGSVIEYAYDANGNRCVKSVCAPCQGDLNADGRVDAADLRILAGSFGRKRCSPDTHCPGDFDADGDVDSKDLKVFKAEFGRRDCRICQEAAR